MIITKQLNFKSKGHCDIIDITNEVEKEISNIAEINSGIITIFVPGATGGLTTVEYEPGLIKDLPELFEKLIPSNKSYHHDMTWHDGNGHSHLRASLLGPSITVPFVNKSLTLGTWQQIIFIDFDNKPRNRNLVLQIMGE